MEGKTMEKIEKMDDLIVSVDMTVNDVVQLDSKGKLLSFATEPDKFLFIPPEVWKNFSHENKTRYYMAQEMAEVERQFSVDEKLKESIEVKGDLGTATSMLEVEGKDTDRFKYYLGRPDKLGSHARKGYIVDHDAKFRSSGNNKLSKMGQAELVVMKVPKERAELNAKEKANRRQRRLDPALPHGIIETGPNEIGKSEIVKLNGGK